VAYTLCEKGHIYDPNAYSSCNFCAKEEQAETGMAVELLCEKGHMYNPKVYSSCPVCALCTVSKSGMVVLEQCEKGHVYDSNAYSSCPECAVCAVKHYRYMLCEKGHLYDISTFSSCSICAEEKQADGAQIQGADFDAGLRPDSTESGGVRVKTETPDFENIGADKYHGENERGAFTLCEKGHLYDLGVNTFCPICAEENCGENEPDGTGIYNPGSGEGLKIWTDSADGKTAESTFMGFINRIFVRNTRRPT
jgi:hypothetical protein